MVDGRDVTRCFQHRAADARRSRRWHGWIARPTGARCGRARHARSGSASFTRERRPSHQALQADQLVHAGQRHHVVARVTARARRAPGCPSRHASSRTARRGRAAGPARRPRREKRSGVPTTTTASTGSSAAARAPSRPPSETPDHEDARRACRAASAGAPARRRASRRARCGRAAPASGCGRAAPARRRGSRSARAPRPAAAPRTGCPVRPCRHSAAARPRPGRSKGATSTSDLGVARASRATSEALTPGLLGGAHHVAQRRRRCASPRACSRRTRRSRRQRPAPSRTSFTPIRP